MQLGSASRAFPGSDCCGDQVGQWIRDSLATLCVVDGLGHGPEAESAAKAVLTYLDQNPHTSLESLFAGADEAVRNTRGAALGLVLVNSKEMSLTHAGVGNTRALLLKQGNPAPKILSSTYGIVGAGYRKLRPETASFAPGDLLLLYTDGLPEYLDTTVLARSSNRHPEEIAEQTLQRWALGTDDAAVLVARMESLG
ncbi:MAG: SpoIIE family protein phosphatase [bacterium]|nr:SpoIIE family protein phosphatase [bacterium]